MISPRPRREQRWKGRIYPIRTGHWSFMGRSTYVATTLITDCPKKMLL
jgi:hypothetical protein